MSGIDPVFEDKDIVELIHKEYFSKNSEIKDEIEDFVDKKAGIAKNSKVDIPNKWDLLSPLVKSAYVYDSYEDKIRLHDMIDQAYNNEVFANKAVKSISRESKGREVWYDGSLTNSPFDIIVDLNIIELVLFGSEAEWKEDVYEWPADSGGEDGGGGKDSKGTEDTADPGASGDGSGTGDSGDKEDTGADGSGADDDSGADGKDNKTPPPEESKIICMTEAELLQMSSEILTEKVSLFQDLCPKDKCGNAVVEEGEQCDDGGVCADLPKDKPILCASDKDCPQGKACEPIAGDGCNAVCAYETKCNSPDCLDKEASTLKPPSCKDEADQIKKELEKLGILVTDEKTSAKCPKGSFSVDKDKAEETKKKVKAGLSPDEKEMKKKAIVQSPNYLGPFIGGTLKNLPKSNKPPCPYGQSLWQPSAGGAQGLVCVPDELCADIIDHPNVTGSICVDIQLRMRPESPYPVTEGCIHCHILGMIDVMQKTLEKGVNPLENNMTAWGSSSRWGPPFAFDVDVQSAAQQLWNAVFSPKYEDFSAGEQTKIMTDQLIQQSESQLDPNIEKVTVKPLPGESPVETLKREQQVKEKALLKYQLGLLTSAEASKSQTIDSQFFSDINGVLDDLQKGFSTLKETFEGLAIGNDFSKKPECRF